MAESTRDSTSTQTQKSNRNVRTGTQTGRKIDLGDYNLKKIEAGTSKIDLSTFDKNLGYHPKPFTFNVEFKRLKRKIKHLEEKCILDGWISAEEFIEITRKFQHLMIKATETNQNGGNQQ